MSLRLCSLCCAGLAGTCRRSAQTVVRARGRGSLMRGLAGVGRMCRRRVTGLVVRQ